MKNYLKNKIVLFLVFVFAFYIGWYLIYSLWIQPKETIDLFVIDITVSASKWILEHLGYRVFTGIDRLIGIDGSPGLWVGDNCNGIKLFAIFTGFVIAYPGNWKKKLVFIPSGILIIEILNVFRIVVLAILDTHSRAWTEFNHTYTFTILIYGCIFLMWMYWTNRIADNSFIKKEGN